MYVETEPGEEPPARGVLPGSPGYLIEEGVRKSLTDLFPSAHRDDVRFQWSTSFLTARSPTQKQLVTSGPPTITSAGDILVGGQVATADPLNPWRRANLLIDRTLDEVREVILPEGTQQITRDGRGFNVAQIAVGSFLRPGTTNIIDFGPVPPMEMLEVSFGGTKYHRVESDDGLTTYVAPQWVDENGDGDAADEAIEEHNDAVAFTRNTTPRIGAKIKIPQLPAGLSILVRATGPGAVQIPPTAPAVAGDEITLPLTQSTGPVVNTIKYYNRKSGTKAFALKWELSLDAGTTWMEVATTKHTVYVTLNDPAPVIPLRQETLFEIGCRNADGEILQNSAIDKI